MPRKPASKNVVYLCSLLNIFETFRTYFSIQANSVDPDQTAPSSLIWVHTVCKKRLLKSQADDKPDDNCCDWQFKG